MISRIKWTVILCACLLSCACSKREMQDKDLSKEKASGDVGATRGPSTGNTDKLNIADHKRNYKSPSIMVRKDFRESSLLTNLIVLNWDVIHDDYGRLCRYVSPEMTYAELQKYLIFYDEDVTKNKYRKTGEPDAFIKTEWMTCNITYVRKQFDGKDKTVRVKAVLVDNEQQALADEAAEHDRKKNFIIRILTAPDKALKGERLK